MQEAERLKHLQMPITINPLIQFYLSPRYLSRVVHCHILHSCVSSMNAKISFMISSLLCPQPIEQCEHIVSAQIMLEKGKVGGWGGERGGWGMFNSMKHYLEKKLLWAQYQGEKRRQASRLRNWLWVQVWEEEKLKQCDWKENPTKPHWRW